MRAFEAAVVPTSCAYRGARRTRGDEIGRLRRLALGATVSTYACYMGRPPHSKPSPEKRSERP